MPDGKLMDIGPDDATPLERLEMENVALKLQLLSMEMRKLEERRRQILEAVASRKTSLAHRDTDAG